MWYTRPYHRRLALALLVGVAPAWSQSRLLQQGNYALPTGMGLQPQFDLEKVSPVVHEWYAPQHLFESQVRPWYVNDTQYARETYVRYVDQLLEGFEHFDTFGRSLGRGWLVYNWQHVRNERNGSLIDKGITNVDGAQFSSAFQNLVVSSDTDGRSIYRMSVGDRIFTRFSPLTFYKPRFNGVRLDYANDRIEGTMLLSRPSQPDGFSQTNITHMIGGHGRAQVAANATLGLTYVNAYSTRTDLDFELGNPLNGIVPSRQDQPVQKLWVRIRDDSPSDFVGGGRVFRHEIVLEDTSGQVFRGRDIGLLPTIEGGRRVDGALVTDGSETVVLLYDLAQLAELPALQDGQLLTSAVRRATVELSLANDYLVEMASDRQSDGDRYDPEIVFLPVRRADGNVQDQSNSQQISIDFGFPTANELIGVDWDLAYWRGLSIQGEAVLNRRHQKYPGPRPSQQYHFVRESTAAYANAAYSRNPWSVFVEVFAIEDGYSTSHWVAETNKGLAFKADIPRVYEFVDDDDDNNAVPEWIRPFQGITGQQEAVQEQAAFPGYDENRDFIYDHNQNRNLMPDYDEPFLRFRSDRPEFLFGMDMNHNATVDRFENDDQPDYPYKRDHRGYNVYTRVNAGPDASLTLGRQRMELISGDGHTRSVYALGTWVQELGSAGRLRVFDFGARVRDDIADHLRQWVQPLGTAGRMRDLADGLPAMDTWRNTFYVDWTQRLGDVRALHRFKLERWWQRDSKEQVAAREGRRLSGFTGVINKAEWSIPIGLAVLEPRFKSEYRSDRPFRKQLSTARSIEETVFLLWTQPLFAERTTVNYYAGYGKQLFDTEIQAGLEVSRLWMIDGRREDIDQGFSGQTVVFQLVNRVAYQGYKLVSRTGLQFTRRKLEDGERQDSNLVFMVINAGLR
ncbi:MAG: hypothetical protein VYD18_10735 [Candidatus Latescibacterota bacterium]|nr:hypothetical protein [Candidatus Latescibacterota bacterium]